MQSLQSRKSSRRIRPRQHDFLRVYNRSLPYKNVCRAISTSTLNGRTWRVCIIGGNHQLWLVGSIEEYLCEITGIQ